VGIFPNENPYFSKKYFYYAVDIKAVGSVFEKLKNVDFQLILTRNLNQFSSLWYYRVIDHNKQIKKCIRMMFTHYKIFSALKSVRELNTIFVWGRSKSFLISNWIGERGSRIVVGGILVGGLGNRIFWYVFFPENPIFWYAKLDNNVAHIITVRLERAARTRLIYRT